MNRQIGWTLESESHASGFAAWRILSMHSTVEEARMAEQRITDGSPTRVMAYFRESRHNSLPQQVVSRADRPQRKVAQHAAATIPALRA